MGMSCHAIASNRASVVKESKRSPDERKRHPGFPLDPHIAALMRATSFAYAASTALLAACGSAIERKKAFG
jgi:hypothetical protein